MSAHIVSPASPAGPNKWTNAKVGAALGVSKDTIRNWLEDDEDTSNANASNAGNASKQKRSATKKKKAKPEIQVA